MYFFKKKLPFSVMEAQRIKAAPARRNAGADFECSAKIKNKKR
jgi:hypothetical protein